jgi:hypothetical protein
MLRSIYLFFSSLSFFSVYVAMSISCTLPLSVVFYLLTSFLCFFFFVLFFSVELQSLEERESNESC